MCRRWSVLETHCADDNRLTVLIGCAGIWVCWYLGVLVSGCTLQQILAFCPAIQPKCATSSNRLQAQSLGTENTGGQIPPGFSFYVFEMFPAGVLQRCQNSTCATGHATLCTSYKKVKGRSHTVDKRISMHPHKPHATSQPSRFSHTHRVCTDSPHN